MDGVRFPKLSIPQGLARHGASVRELTDFYRPRDTIDLPDLGERQQCRGREEKETPARLHSAKLPARST